MRKILLIITLSLSLIGCAALGRGWNDDANRENAKIQGQRTRDFVSSVTGNAIAGAAAGGLVSLGFLISGGWKKKEPK